jgi:hypothetical protein
MAHPIISFIHPENSKRYFFVLDTFFNYPETIPMNLLNLMQYLGLDNFGEAEVIYSVYSKLMQDGSTMPGDSFDKINPNLVRIIYQTAYFSEVNEAYHTVSLQLEEIFQHSKNKEEFLDAYEDFIENLNLYPPYPFHYYLSFDKTYRCIFSVINNEKFVNILTKYFDNKFPEDDKIREPDNWLLKGYLLSYKAEFREVFFELAEQNLIELAYVPHILREDPKISNLFMKYDLQSVLPGKNLDYDIQHRYSAILKDVNLTPEILRQILSNIMHNVYSPDYFHNLAGREVFCLTKNDLNLNGLFDDIFHNTFNEKVHLVNFYNEHGNALYPHGLNKKWYSASGYLNSLAIGPESDQQLFDSNGLKTALNLSGEFIFERPDALISLDSKGNHLFGKYDRRTKNYKDHKFISLPYNFHVEHFRYYPEHDSFFLESGIISLSGEALSPQCFMDAGNIFSEGLLAIKMNGKWGYIDHSFNLLIPPVFGLAEPFRGGFARVFLYEEEYFDFDENWTLLPSWIPSFGDINVKWDEEIFEQKFPNFPKYYWYNLKGREMNFIHDVDEPDIEKGTFGIINLKGEICHIYDKNKYIYFPEYGPFHFIESIDEIIDLYNFQQDLLPELKRYNYRKFNPRYTGTHKKLQESEKEAIRVELKKQNFNKFFGLPTEAKKNEDFIYELREEKLLRHSDLPCYLHYHERFIELALNQGEIEKHSVPWAFKEKFKGFKSDNELNINSNDDLPF